MMVVLNLLSIWSVSFWGLKSLLSSFTPQWGSTAMLPCPVAGQLFSIGLPRADVAATSKVGSQGFLLVSKPSKLSFEMCVFVF